MAIANSIGQFGGGIAGLGSANDALEDWAALQAPEFSDQDYERIQYAGDFNPEAYATPEAAQYQTISEDPRVRGIQMDALQKLIDQSSGAADAKSNAARFGALDEANQLARGREQAIAMQAQRRGQGGNGMSSVMQAQAAQMAANRARGGTMQAVQDAALEKLAATQGAIGAAGNVRGQDFQRAAANSDIINRFNQFNTQARNAAAMGSVDARNQAGMRNTNTKQDVMGRNAGVGNASMDRKDRNAMNTFGAKSDRLGAIHNASDRKAKAVGDTISGAANTAADLFRMFGSGYGG